MIDAIQATPMMQRKTPDATHIKNTQDVEKTARDFTKVFFDEYVGIMLEESKEADEEFSCNVYRGLHSQVLADKLTDSDAGQRMTEMMIKEINKLQAKVQRGHHD